jgi:hypothetical protein
VRLGYRRVRLAALRDSPSARDPSEAEPDVWQVHDPQARLAIAQDERRLPLIGNTIGPK